MRHIRMIEYIMSMDTPKEKEIVVILHNIRSGHNVGSIFRTADATGVERIILTGYTPLPVDKFGRPVSSIVKTALGAESSVPWSSAKRVGSVITRLKKDGFLIVGLEQDERSIDYRDIPSANKIALLSGNEVRGISSRLRDTCDMLMEIPMRGKKESLNVSVATGIALYAISDVKKRLSGD